MGGGEGTNRRREAGPAEVGLPQPLRETALVPVPTKPQHLICKHCQSKSWFQSKLLHVYFNITNKDRSVW